MVYMFRRESYNLIKQHWWACAPPGTGESGGEGMQTAGGKSILNQIVAGRLRFCQLAPAQPKPSPALPPEDEEDRFFQAQRLSVLELAALYDRMSRRVGEGTASIFAIHAMLLEDEDFVRSVRNLIRRDEVSAEYAVWRTGLRLAATFSAMDNLYMQARAGDIRDITHRVIWRLRGEQRPDPLEEGAAILVSDEFLPSEVAELDRERLLGVVTRKGSVDSHTALLLRACQVPAMAQVSLDARWDGHMAVLDGINHRLCLDPDQETLERMLPNRS